MPARKRRAAFVWDAAASRFRRTSNGQFLSRKVVIRAFELALAKNRRQLRAVSLQLRDGTISLRAWQKELASRLKDSHLWGAAIARGGKLSQSDLGRVGRLVRDRYQYLARFGDDIAAGRVALDGQFLARAESYVLHARQARHEAERYEMWEVQHMTHEENVLSAVENCDGCLEATAMGRVPIFSLPPIGTRTCLARCQCEILYS